MQQLQAQKILAKTQISLADYVINPYRGCAACCAYCYAHSTDTRACAAVKINAPQVLEKELRFVKPRRVLIGSTTECFPPQDAQYGVTRRILEILNDKQIPYTILTKSHLTENYLDLLAANPGSKIYLTLNFHTQQLIDTFEQATSPLSARLAALKKMLHTGIDVRVHAGPFIPGVCNISHLLDILPDGVKEMDIEIYHHHMGNFNNIIARAKNNIGPETSNELTSVYAEEENYNYFIQKIRDELIRHRHNRPIAFYLIVPSWKKFYDRSIDYENTRI